MSLPDFSEAKVLVVGDLMLDRYWTGPTGRVSPEAPVPVVNISGESERLGGAGNVALNLRSLSVNTTLIGIVGNDSAGERLQKMLVDADISASLSVDHERPTISKLRILSRNQQLLRLDFEEDLSGQAKSLLPRVESVIADQDVVVLSDYGKGSLIDAPVIISLARKHSIPCLVDPKGSDFSKYRGATMITPNQSEFEAVVGAINTRSELVQKACELMAQFDFDAIAVTQGAKGIHLVTHEGDVHIDALAKEVYDVTGAGDTVIATMAAMLATETSFEEAVMMANRAAAVVVGKLGTAPISRQELHRVLNDHGSIFGLEHAIKEVEVAKARGERVVMTNGCFDVLHAGHVRYLEEAATLGDRLLVAVNTDASVKRLKGADRPINSLGDRLEVLAGLSSVDWLVPFDTTSVAPVVEALKPNVLVKGGDYAPNEVVGHDIVTAYGGEVRVLALVPDRSTTALIERILATPSSAPESV